MLGGLDSQLVSHQLIFLGFSLPGIGPLMLFSIQASFSDATILAHLVLLFRFLSPVPLHVNAGERGRAPWTRHLRARHVLLIP